MQFTGADAVALIALAIGMGWILTGPIGVALAARIRGARAAGDLALAGEVEDLHGRLGEARFVRTYGDGAAEEKDEDRGEERSHG